MARYSLRNDKLNVQPFTVDITETLRSGIFISGTSQTGKSTLAMQISKLLIENRVIVFVVDPTQAWYKFNLIKNTVLLKSIRQRQGINWNDETTLFDTSRLNPFEQKRFMEAFCAQVLNIAINRSNRPEIVVVFEEAHTPFYNGSMRAKKSLETARMLTQGANFNIRFLAITQFPSMCDKLLIKLPQQRYMGRTSEPNDLKYLSGIIGRYVDELPYLQRGEFLYYYNGEISKVRIKPYGESINRNLE